MSCMWMEKEVNTQLFQKQKIQTLSAVDLSRKGSIDHNIVELVTYINSLQQYVTTSSCSGRTLIFEEDPERKGKKKACRWLYTSHDQISANDVITSLNVTGDAVFKFEPFILHVHCQSLKDAKLMHEVAVASGYRNSGITIGNKGKIMVAVRSTQSLEAPISLNGMLIVDEKYISHLVNLANNKMEENLARIERFSKNLHLSLNEEKEKTSAKTVKSKRKHTERSALASQKVDRVDSPVDTFKPSKDDPFLSIMDECTMDGETGLFSIIYSEDS